MSKFLETFRPTLENQDTEKEKPEKVKEMEEKLKKLKEENFQLKEKLESQNQAISKLEKEATVDFLTGLLNRRGFFSRFSKEINRVNRFGDRLEVLYLDLNDLKETNDTLGHDAGDELILELTKSIEENIRSFDFAGRIGGDEFVVVLTQTEESTSDIITERMKEKQNFSVAIGSASYIGKNNRDNNIDLNKSIKKVIKEAEINMYKDKVKSRESKD